MRFLCPCPAGGSATQSEMIHQRIRFLAQETKTPVLTFAEDIAASGACALCGPCCLLFHDIRFTLLPAAACCNHAWCSHLHSQNLS